MRFVLIGIDDYTRLFVENNPGSDRDEVATRLEDTLAAAKAGARCQCGAPIWVIGSAEAGNSCFTCMTGEATPDSDYEIAKACDLHEVR
jgi:hypothetical protein